MNDYRHLFECLARHVLNTYHTKDARRGFLQRWYKRHGKISTEKLKAEIKQQWAMKSLSNAKSAGK